MRSFALVSALFVAPLVLAAPSGDSFDPSTASASELVLRELKPAQPAPRSSGLRQATRAEIINRLARRGRGGEKRQAATSPGVPVCIPDSTAASGTPKYAVFQGVQVANLGTNNYLGVIGAAPNDAACAMSCDATTDCIRALVYSGDCYGYNQEFVWVTTGATFFDALLQGETCATAKTTFPAAADATCCNLYY